jgi:hypothetical protein
MKKLVFFLSVLFVSSETFSQYEFTFSLGTSISNSQEHSNFIETLNMDSLPEGYAYNIRNSDPRIGADISLGYAYYFKYNIRAFAAFSYQEKGYRHNTQWSSPSPSSTYHYIVTTDNQYDFNYLGSELGITYVTDLGITISLGVISYSLLSANHYYNQAVYYPNSPSLSTSTNDPDYDYPDGYPDVSDDLYPKSFATSIAIGYEFGDFSLDLSYTNIGRYGKYYDDPVESIFNTYTFDAFDLSSVSISVGYHRLFIK